jgi:hypothetical protein
MSSPKHQKGIRIFLAIMAAGFLLIVAAMSFYAGKLYTNRNTNALLDNYHNLLLFTPIIQFSNLKAADILPAYETPVRAADLDTFCYDIPKVPTPFVGSAPWPGRFGNATINSQQFRYDRDIEVPKPEGVYRIFLTGGSVAFGGGAPSNSTTISGFLEQILNDSLSATLGKNIEVVNAACPAWASTQERIWIEQRLSEMQPDLIISFSGNNDVHWGSAGADLSFFRTYWDHFLNKVIDNTYSTNGRASYPEIVATGTQPTASALVARQVAKNVFLVNALATHQGFRYVYILQPNLPTTGKGLSPQEEARLAEWDKARIQYFRDCYAAINESMSSLRVPGFQYIDGRAIFDQLPAGTPILYDAYHYGDRGNRIVAEAIAKEIIEDITR